MNSAAIIEEIKQLSPAEQVEVIQFTSELARKRQLTATELGEMANRLAESDEPAEISRLKSALRRGFSGESGLPNARRHNLPRRLYADLLGRVQQRPIPGKQLTVM